MSGSIAASDQLNSIPTAKKNTSTGSLPSPWRAILWKDWNQIRPAVLAIIAGMAGAQAVILLANLAFVPSGSWSSMTEITAVLAMISPALVAIAAAGMLIGHERQTRSWNWSSGLPISWGMALGSKLLVSVASVILTMAVLLIVPIVVGVFLAQLPANSWVLSNYGSLFAVALAIDTIVFFMLSALIFHDALTALIVGAVWILGLQVLVVAIPLQIASSFGIYSDRVPDWLLAIEMGVVLIAGIAALLLAFRWRWGAGQTATLSILPKGWSALAAPAYAPVRVGRAPSQKQMLLWLSLQSSLGKRLLILALFLILAMVNFTTSPESLAVAGVFACSLFGITAFEGDQTNRRYGFLADRGVSPRLLTLSKLLIPILFALFVAVVVGSSIYWNERFGSFRGPNSLFALAGLMTLLTATLCGALASLSFEKAIISAVVTLVTTIIAAILYVSLSNVIQWADQQPYWLSIYSYTLFLLLSLPALTWAILRQVPQWLREIRLKLAGRYFALTASLIGLPILLVASLGFLFVPKVPWQGLAPTAFQRPPASIPDLSERVDLLQGNMPPAIVYYDPTYVSDSLEEFQQRLIVDGKLDASFIDEGSMALQQLQAAVDGPRVPVEATQAARWMNEALSATAAAALLYLQSGEMELARTSLQLHGQLRAVAAEELAPDTVAARIASAHWLAKSLEKGELQQLASSAELSQWLLPDLEDFPLQMEQLVRARASYDLTASRGQSLNQRPKGWTMMYSNAGMTAYYPPLRWREERSLALQLQTALQLLQKKELVWNQFQVGWRYLHEFWLHQNQLLPIRQQIHARLGFSPPTATGEPTPIEPSREANGEIDGFQPPRVLDE
ncbi:MAG: hypothetical protein NXI32_25040 [bacterium]|nr:hypothetical protein [bacterium]